MLVPANLIATVATLVLAITGQSMKMRWTCTLSSVLAITLFFHISTWFIIGIITPVTFILFGLGTTCLAVNILAVAYRREIARFSQSLLSSLS